MEATNTHHSSPSGFTFVLRPVSKIPERLRRPAAAKLFAFVEGISAQNIPLNDEKALEQAFAASAGTQMAHLDELNDLAALALLVSWSAPEPITLDSLLDLPSEDYNAIRTAVAPLANDLLPDFGPTPEAGTPTTP